MRCASLQQGWRQPRALARAQRLRGPFGLPAPASPLPPRPSAALVASAPHPALAFAPSLDHRCIPGIMKLPSTRRRTTAARAGEGGDAASKKDETSRNSASSGDAASSSSSGLSSSGGSDSGAAGASSSDPSSQQQPEATNTGTGDAAIAGSSSGQGDSAAAAAAAAGGSTALSASGGGGSGSGTSDGGGGGYGAVSLVRRFQGPGYTFLLAGFLKIMTIGGLAASAPIDASRTAFGQASQYMLVPVGLAMAWLAKQIADSGIQESKRFLPTMTAILVFIYFLLVKLLYKADPTAVYDMTSRRPRARMAGPMAEIRQGAGDRALLEAGSEADPRAYRPRRAGDQKALMDDLAWYEGRYPDGAAAAAPGAAKERIQPRANLRSFLSPPDER